MPTRKNWLESKILESLKNGQPREKRGIAMDVGRSIEGIEHRLGLMVRRGQIERVGPSVYQRKVGG